MDAKPQNNATRTKIETSERKRGFDVTKLRWRIGSLRGKLHCSIPLCRASIWWEWFPCLIVLNGSGSFGEPHIDRHNYNEGGLELGTERTRMRILISKFWFHFRYQTFTFVAILYPNNIFFAWIWTFMVSVSLLSSWIISCVFINKKSKIKRGRSQN